jgi:hypothetical protein
VSGLERWNEHAEHDDLTKHRPVEIASESDGWGNDAPHGMTSDEFAPGLGAKASDLLGAERLDRHQEKSDSTIDHSNYHREWPGAETQDDMQAVEVADAIEQSMPNESTWRELTREDRLAALRQVESASAEAHGRQALPVEWGEFEKGYLGEFDGERIRISPEQTEGWEEAATTIAHEARHAYQYEAVREPWKDKRSDIWSDNLEDYISPSPNGLDFDYYQQPVERDAFSFQDRVMAQIERRHQKGGRS